MQDTLTSIHLLLPLQPNSHLVTYMAVFFFGLKLPHKSAPNKTVSKV